MRKFEIAKELAAAGFHVFPLIPNKKLPAIKNYTACSVDSPKDVDRLWFDPILEIDIDYNIGIATTNFKDMGLLVVDVDNKGEKNGSESLFKLEMEGFDFPKTCTQKTLTGGGLHLIYSAPKAVKQGESVLGHGLDVRSRGGYIVARGSEINGKTYLMNSHAVMPAPQWMIDKCNESVVKERTAKPAKKISQRGAMARGRDYLLNHAPVAVEGNGGDRTTFIVANKLKDIGVSEANAVQIMLDNWNENCQPPWSPKDIQNKVKNAYSYGQNSIGSDSPENDFEPIKEEETVGPVDTLNKEYAFIVLGGKSTILKQGKKGEVSYMSPPAFHDLLAADTMQTGNGRKKQVSEMWFNSPKRATYNSIELLPGKKAPPGVYNLWRGFSCEPAKDDEITKDMEKGVSMFREHALENVCLGNKELCHWLMGYFSHLIQKPWQKPLTALVFKGKKGVGKNAIINRVGSLFNGHYLLTANRRYLTSNFNKHLANLLLFVLDEVSWGGDKQAEGILKDLITGNTHLIEHKGREMFSARNVIRLCIIGNENWVIPATEDERRFAVFNIGTKRQRDKTFFKEMERLLGKKQGNKLLMRQFMDFDLQTVDVNEAPQTIGLLDQKIESLPAISAWWFSSLKDGAILGTDFNDIWPTSIGRDQLRAAFTDYSKQRGMRSWLPNASAFGRDLTNCCPGIQNKRLREGQSRIRSYALPTLAICRQQFDQFIGHQIEWEPEESNVIDLFS